MSVFVVSPWNCGKWNYQLLRIADIVNLNYQYQQFDLVMLLSNFSYQQLHAILTIRTSDIVNSY